MKYPALNAEHPGPQQRVSRTQCGTCNTQSRAPSTQGRAPRTQRRTSNPQGSAQSTHTVLTWRRDHRMLVQVGRSAVLRRLGKMRWHLGLREMHDGLSEMRHSVEHVPRERVLHDGDLCRYEGRRGGLHWRRRLRGDGRWGWWLWLQLLRLQLLRRRRRGLLRGLRRWRRLLLLLHRLVVVMVMLKGRNVVRRPNAWLEAGWLPSRAMGSVGGGREGAWEPSGLRTPPPPGFDPSPVGREGCSVSYLFLLSSRVPFLLQFWCHFCKEKDSTD